MELIKRHPWITGGVAASAIVLVLLMSGGDSSGGTYTVPGGSDADYQANLAASTQLQEAQYGAQAASAQYGAALSSQQDQDATQLGLANIQAQISGNNNSVTQAVSLAQISATQESTDLANTLTAQLGQSTLNTQQQIAALGTSVENNQIQATVDMHTSDNATLLGVTQIQANQSTQFAGILEQATVAGQQAAIAQSTIAAQVANHASDNNSKGLFSSIFS